MNDRKLSVLAVIAALMIVLTVAQSRFARRAPSRSAVPAALLQGINPDLIARIEIKTGDKTVTLSRAEKSFVISSKDDYPAAAGEINNLITGCLDIQAGEKITGNQDIHPDLQVSEEKAVNIIQFFDKDQKRIAGLVLGKRDPAAGGSYVRLIDSDDVYICQNVPWIRTNALDYAEKEILNVSSSDIARVSSIGPEQTYAIKADENNQPVLEDIPDGKVVKDTEYKQVFNALSSLSFDDVRKSDEGLTFDHTYICRLKNSTVYTLKIAQRDKEAWARISAQFTDTAPVVKEKREESEEELKKKETKLLAHEAVEKFNRLHQGWVYQLPEWKAKNLTRKLDELLNDKEQPKTETESPPGETPAADQPLTETPKPETEKPAEEPQTPAPAAETPPAPAPAPAEPAPPAETPK